MSEKTLDKLMHISSDSNTAIWKAFANSTADLWDQNLVDGKYVIAFQLNHGLGPSLQKLLPEVFNISVGIMTYSKLISENLICNQ